ncbi:MAG: universal stress protein [Chloroflexi bacterium]|nr:universal stress protein [Chloroflexota bacterium]
MFERITAPLDGSEMAEAVLPYLEYFAQMMGSEIDLVGVSGPEREMDRLLKVYLDKLAEQMAARGIKARSIILYGRPEEEIIDYSEKNNIGLVVMSARGRSGVRRWEMGSVVERVSRASNTPLLVVKERPVAAEIPGARLIIRMMVPLDGSKLGESALPYVRFLASRIKAELVLLQVISPTPSLMATESYYATYSNEIIAAQQAEAENYLKSLAAGISGEGTRTSYKVEIGIPSEKILEVIDREKISLVGMSTHGRTGIKRWVYGSIASKVLSSSPAPVLLVRAPEMKISR